MVNMDSLKQLLEILRTEKVRCGIGGSYLLQMYELCDNPQDVDFWVEPSDIEKVREIFKECKEIKEKLQLPEQYHFKFEFKDIVADFVSCFITKPNQYSFEYNIKPDSIEYMPTEKGYEIPCTALEDWYIVYSLLGRKKKADIIKKYIKSLPNSRSTSAIKIKEAIEDSNNTLSAKMKKELDDFAMDCLQVSLFDFDFFDLKPKD
ncbi:hypothetical protein [Butyrivibrio sp. MB2005]|uniref:hypothetical protein n=1 Tax=Butyrivibrio sp. MB2005 TaxID=1280678 RepID=UPI00041C0ED9|nr:hypothetical protein [Butyrivibrio sp. MB2005]